MVLAGRSEPIPAGINWKGDASSTVSREKVIEVRVTPRYTFQGERVPGSYHAYEKRGSRMA